MKINKGIVKNINKKLIASLLAVSLTTGLTGCGEVSYGIPTETTDKGETVYTSTKYDELIHWKVVVFDFKGEQSFYLVESASRGNFLKYYNVFGGQKIYDEALLNTELSILAEDYLRDYLITYDRVQTEYTEQELKDILNQIKEDYEEEKDKQLVIGD